MPKPTKREESRLRGIAVGLESQAEGAVAQLSIRFAWARRRVVEGSYSGPQGEVRQHVDTYDLWFEDPPEDPPRTPDAHASSAHAAAERLLEYEWVRHS